MSGGGDKPQPPHCALGRFSGEHDDEAVHWKLWKTYRVLVVAMDDDRLSPEMHNAAVAIGNFLYGTKPHG